MIRGCQLRKLGIVEVQEGWDSGTKDICIKNTGSKVVTRERECKVDCEGYLVSEACRIWFASG
jgi:hypothetical protein